MRELIFTTLSTDPILNALGINADTIHTNHSADTPNNKPFVVIRYLGTTPAPFKHSPVNSRTVQFWAHDEPSDYTRIGSILKRIRILVESLEGSADSDGGYLVDVTWQGNSDDFPDDDAKTVTRNSQYQFTGSAVD